MEDSNLPSLVCLKSIRTKTGVIHSGHDVIYIPDIPTQGLEGLYRKFPLDFDGIHYSMPFDQVSASSKEAPVEMVELKVTPVDEHQVWMSWKPVMFSVAAAAVAMTSVNHASSPSEPGKAKSGTRGVGITAKSKEEPDEELTRQLAASDAGLTSLRSGTHPPSGHLGSTFEEATTNPVPDSLQPKPVPIPQKAEEWAKYAADQQDTASGLEGREEVAAPGPNYPRKGKPNPSPATQRRSADRSWKRKVNQVLQEYAVSALTGLPPPPLQESEMVLVTRKAAAWESLRPTGNPPELALSQKQHDVWDL